MFSQRIKLRPKLLLSFFLVTCVTGVIVTLHSIYFFSAKIEQEALHNIHTSLQVAELVYKNQLEKTQDIVDFISTDSGLNSLVVFGIKPKIQEYLVRTMQRDTLHQVLIVNARHGQIIAESHREQFEELNDVGSSENLLNNNLVRKVLSSGHSVSSTELIQYEGQNMLAISAAAPILKETLDTEVFAVVLVRHVISNRSLLLDKIQRLLHISAMVSHQRRILSAKVPADGSMPLLNTQVYQRVQQEGYYEIADIHDSGQLAAHKALRDSDGHMVGVLSISIPVHEYADTMQQAIINYVLIMLLCILGASLLGVWLAQTILVPLERLLQGVRRMRSGDLDHRIELLRKDELGVLAQAFNGMSAQLSEFVKVLKNTISTLTRAGNALSGERNLNNLLEIFVAEARNVSHADSGILYIMRKGELHLKIMQSESQDLFMRDTKPWLHERVNLEAHKTQVSAYVALHKRAICVPGKGSAELHVDACPASLEHNPLQIDCEDTMLVLPLLDRLQNTIGVLQLINPQDPQTQRPLGFTEGQLDIISAITSQAAIAIENAHGYEKIQKQKQSFERFVPTEFLHLLGKREIIDIEVGDASLEFMSVLFADVRSFTRMSETQPPGESFDFLNDYLSHIGPSIARHHGFIDKFIGDAIMALFAGSGRNNSADDAVMAALGVLEGLEALNESRIERGKMPVGIGMGVHTGPVALGTIGFEGRVETTVIGDTVNMSSRVQSLTKMYGITFGLTGFTLEQLQRRDHLLVREVDTVQVKGKEKAHTIYDVFNADPEDLRARKLETLETYQQALQDYRQRHWNDAIDKLLFIKESLPEDRVIEVYLRRCEHFKQSAPGSAWQGITRLDAK